LKYKTGSMKGITLALFAVCLLAVAGCQKERISTLDLKGQIFSRFGYKSSYSYKDVYYTMTFSVDTVSGTAVQKMRYTPREDDPIDGEDLGSELLYVYETGVDSNGADYLKVWNYNAASKGGKGIGPTIYEMPDANTIKVPYYEDVNGSIKLGGYYVYSRVK